MKTNRVMLLVLALLGVTLVETAQAFYNPSTGRWLSRDPIGERGGLNVFQFSRNNPSKFVDKNGLVIVVITPQPQPDDGAGGHHEGQRIDPAKEWEKSDPNHQLFIVDSISDANAKLRTCKGCIEKLNVQGHGAPGYQDVAAEDGTLPDFPDSPKNRSGSKGVGVGDYLNPTYKGSVGFGLFDNVKFCPKCVVVLRGCNVGKGNAGRNLMKQIHEATKCEVWAYTSSTTCGKDGGLSGSDGWFDSGRPQVVYPAPDPLPPYFP